MNAPSPTESSALAVAAPNEYDLAHMNTASLILGPSFERIQAFAAMMAKGSVSVPNHLKDKPADCLAIVLQSLSWGMNPFAVAQKTHITQSGALGYESQLVSAVITNSGAVTGQPTFEWIGEWDKILGRVEEKKNSNDKKYYVRGWTDADEKGLGVIIGMTLRGEKEPRKLRVLLSQCYPRFSTQWATDPMQQIGYLAVRKWGRLYAPGTILGVYTPDELEQPGETFMGNVDEVRPTRREEPTSEARMYGEEKFAANFPAWQKVLAKGKKTGAEIIATVELDGKLTDAQKDQILAVKPAQTVAPTTAPAAEPSGEAFTAPGYPEIAGKIAKATNMEQLAEAGSLISHAGCVDSLKEELRDKYDRRAAELNN